jgi:predicted homoserine dehydrogenase-like protein
MLYRLDRLRPIRVGIIGIGSMGKGLAYQSQITPAEAYLNHRALLQPAQGFRTNVYTYAKRDLRCEEKLDGPGGYACYGLIENCDHNEADLGLPICLTEDVTLKRDVRKDEKIHSR